MVGSGIVVYRRRAGSSCSGVSSYRLPREYISLALVPQQQVICNFVLVIVISSELFQNEHFGEFMFVNRTWLLRDNSFCFFFGWDLTDFLLDNSFLN